MQHKRGSWDDSHNALAQIILSRLNNLAFCQGSSNTNGRDVFPEACLLLSNMLFLPRSQPIHRQLLSGLLQIDGRQQQQIVIQSITEQVHFHYLLLPVNSFVDAGLRSMHAQHHA